MKLSVRTLVILTSVSVGAVALGSVASAAELEAPPAESDSASEAGAPQGLSELIDRALATVELKPEQQEALRPLADPIDEADADVAEASRDLTQTLADELEAGTVDRQTVRSKIDALMAARLRQRPVLNKELVALHATLDAEQRAKFADALADGLQKYTAQERQTNELGLTAEQTEKVRGALGGSSAEKPALDQMIAAFRSDSFDPDEISPESDAAARAQQHAAKMLDAVESLASILDPEQRASLANKLRASLSDEVKDGEPALGEADEAFIDDANQGDEDKALSSGDEEDNVDRADDDDALHVGGEGHHGGGAHAHHGGHSRAHRGGQGGHHGAGHGHGHGHGHGFGHGHGHGHGHGRWGGWRHGWGGWGSFWNGGGWSPSYGYVEVEPIVIEPVVAVETLVPGFAFLW